MAGDERDNSPDKAAPAPKDSKVAQLPGEQFQRLGLLKGSMSATKRDITTYTNQIKKTKTTVENEAEKRRDLNTESFFIKCHIYSIKDNLEQCQGKIKHLAKLTVEHNKILQQTTFTHPRTDIIAECNMYIYRAEQDLESYRDKFNICNSDLYDFMDVWDKKVQSQASTRESSPSRSKNYFVKHDHLMPEKLEISVGPLGYRKFRREFSNWMANAYPNGYTEENFRSYLMNHVDNNWANHLNILGNNVTEEVIWKEMDKVMLHAHPLHARRMRFFNSKQKS